MHKNSIVFRRETSFAPKKSNSNSYIYIITFALARAQFVNSSFTNDDFCDLTKKIFSIVGAISKNKISSTYFEFDDTSKSSFMLYDVYPGWTRNSHSCRENVSSFHLFHSMWVEISELCEDFKWKNVFSSPVIFKHSVVFELSTTFERKVFSLHFQIYNSYFDKLILKS